MLIKQWECARVGIIALGWCVLPDSDHARACEHANVRKIIDELHLRQIDLADEVFVLNIGGCIDVSTQDEINYAYAQDKPVIYQEVPEFLRIGEY